MPDDLRERLTALADEWDRQSRGGGTYAEIRRVHAARIRTLAATDPAPDEARHPSPSPTPDVLASESPATVHDPTAVEASVGEANPATGDDRARCGALPPYSVTYIDPAICGGTADRWFVMGTVDGTPGNQQGPVAICEYEPSAHVIAALLNADTAPAPPTVAPSDLPVATGFTSSEAVRRYLNRVESATSDENVLAVIREEREALGDHSACHPGWECADCAAPVHADDTDAGDGKRWLSDREYVIDDADTDAGDEGVRLTEGEVFDLATAIYAEGAGVEWLTTVDGSPNAAAYEIVGRVEDALERVFAARLAEVERFKEEYHEEWMLADAEVTRLRRELDFNIGCSRFTCADDLGRMRKRAEAAEARLSEGVVEWGVRYSSPHPESGVGYPVPSEAVARDLARDDGVALVARTVHTSP